MTTRTRQLTRELASERVMVLLEKKKISLSQKLLTALLLCVLVGGAVFYLLDKDALAAWLPQQIMPQASENLDTDLSQETKWRSQVEELQIKYQVELASRKALEQQILTQDAQIKEMQTELDFFRSNNGQMATGNNRPAARR